LIVFVEKQIKIKMESCNNSSADSRLLEAAAEGQTDLVLQLLEEEGSKLHDHKNQVGIIYVFFLFFQ
jgi:hypothetical protein